MDCILHSPRKLACSGRLSTANKVDRNVARRTSEMRTSALRSKLRAAKVLFIDDSWAVVRDGVIIEHYNDVTSAIAAV